MIRKLTEYVRRVIDKLVSFCKLTLGSLFMGGFTSFSVIINSNLSVIEENIKMQGTANLWRHHDVDDVTLETLLWKR